MYQPKPSGAAESLALTMQRARQAPHSRSAYDAARPPTAQRSVPAAGRRLADNDPLVALDLRAGDEPTDDKGSHRQQRARPRELLALDSRNLPASEYDGVPSPRVR